MNIVAFPPGSFARCTFSRVTHPKFKQDLSLSAVTMTWALVGQRTVITPQLVERTRTREVDSGLYDRGD